MSQRCQPFTCANALPPLIRMNQSRDAKSVTARHGASLCERMKRRQPRSIERPLPSCISTTNSGRASGWMLLGDCDSVARLALSIVILLNVFANLRRIYLSNPAANTIPFQRCGNFRTIRTKRVPFGSRKGVSNQNRKGRFRAMQPGLNTTLGKS